MLDDPRTAGSVAARTLTVLGRAAVLTLTLALGLAGCDNPACVFGGDCSSSGPSGTLSVNAAQLPTAGQIIRNGAPTLDRFLPAPGVAVAPTSPLVLEFSETMQSSELNTAFQIVGGTFGGVVGLMVPAVAGDGRFVVLRPTTDLEPGEYQLALMQDAVLTDLTGQEFETPAGGIIGTFSIAAVPEERPTVIATYPENGSNGVSTSTEIVVVFDRPVTSASVDDDSFVVQVDTMDPANDPLPRPLFAGTGGEDRRIWTWQALDANGDPDSLGAGLPVDVELSPLAAQIIGEEAPMMELMTTTFGFTLAAIDAPGPATILSIPDDAIGVDALLNDTFMLEVQLADGQPDDELTTFVYGDATGMVNQLAVLQRDVALTSAGTFVVLGASDLDLLTSVSPPTGRLADGELTLGFRLTRGGEVSAVSLLDLDAALDGLQGPIQDLVAPTFLGFSGSTETTILRSRTNDLVVLGQADEELRAVDVVASPIGGDVDNGGPQQAVVGSDATGSFVAAPVPLGLVAQGDQPLPFAMTLYDRAFNATTVTGLTFQQVGSSGPSQGGVPSGEVRVEVFDALSGAPLSGVLVLTHEDNSGAVSAVTGGSGTTGSNGRVELPAASVGLTVVTVTTPGYDLFTFHGVPTNFLQVLLEPTGSSASIDGTLFAPDADLNAFTREVYDARRPLSLTPFVTVGTCSSSPFGGGATCTIPSYVADGGRPGALSFLALEFPPSITLFSASDFLRAFVVQLPTPAADITGQTLALEFVRTLADSDPEERAIGGPAFTLNEGATGLDFANLDGDPEVLIEGLPPGLERALTVGAGAGGDLGGSWDVRSAYAGVADGTGAVLGALVQSGSIEADLLVRAQFRDTSGSVSTSRRRFSALPSPPFSLPTPNVSSLVFPSMPGPGGLSFNASVSNSITDAEGRPGLYRLVLTDGSGRRWTLVRPDVGDGAGPNLIVHVADVAGAGGSGLGTGTLDATVEAFGLPPGFTAAQFLWSDVERDYESYSLSTAQFLYPN